MRRPTAVHGSPYRHSYWHRYRKSQLHANRRKPPIHNKKEAMQEESVCASGTSGTALEAMQADSCSPSAASSSRLHCTGVDCSLLGPIPIMTNTLMSSIMLAEQVMCECWSSSNVFH